MTQGEIPMIEWDGTCWKDQFGTVHARASDAMPGGPGLGAVVVAALWDKAMRLTSGNAKERRAIQGAVQARCGGCKVLVALSIPTQESLKNLPSAAILCHACYDVLNSYNKERGRR